MPPSAGKIGGAAVSMRLSLATTGFDDAADAMGNLRASCCGEIIDRPVASGDTMQKKQRSR